MSDHLNQWLNELEKLVKKVSSGLRILSNFKRQYQIFQAYVYTLSVYAIHEIGDSSISIDPQQLDAQGHFVFKNNPRAYYSGSSQAFSYFKINIDGRDFFAVLNIDAYVGVYRITPNPRLNLDIAIITDQIRGNIVDRDDVVFFIECKSVNHASPEYVATALGQSFLIKRNIRRHTPHPYAHVTDLLAVRGTVTPAARGLLNLVSRWRRRVNCVDQISPGQPGENALRREVRNIIRVLLQSI